jgi:hypothetical protein
MLAGPHFDYCAWGPTPKRGRQRFALTAAQGCRSLSLGGPLRFSSFGEVSP